MLKRNLPALKSDKDQHYADILTSLYKRCLREPHVSLDAGLDEAIAYFRDMRAAAQ